MKATFVGGGSHRLLGILRGALAEPGIFEGGEIHLYDPHVARAEAVGRILRQSPEYRERGVTVTWGSSLDRALEGAAAVSVTLMAGSALNFALGNEACLAHGFWGSDNVSPNGALLGVKAAPILLDLARRMERLCPDAWLLDFANPVAVLSGMVNRHTRIKALGVCGGFLNHRADLARVFGKDEPSAEFDVLAAGVNHLSFIVEGTRRGRDLFEELDRVLADDWRMPDLSPAWTEATRANIARSVRNLIRFYRELGVLVFSTEEDGMMHLYYDEHLRERAPAAPSSRTEIETKLKADAVARGEANAHFESHARRELGADFWRVQPPGSVFSIAEDGIFLRALRGIAGTEKAELVTSRLNHGAIEGLPDDVVVEYSQVLYKDRIRSAGRFSIPGVVHGLVGGLAVHQTMLGDACAMGDPELLAHALLAYPVRPYSREARALFRDLILINLSEIPAAFSRAADFLR